MIFSGNIEMQDIICRMQIKCILIILVTDSTQPTGGDL